MEFRYSDHEYSGELKSDHQDIVGTGRSYECVFCKRGFTTAQALGGHMNIHRKDKANKNKHTTTLLLPSSSSSSTSSSSSSCYKVDNRNNFAADLGFYSAIPRGNNNNNNSSYYSTTAVPPHQGGYFSAAAAAPSSDWRQSYSNNNDPTSSSSSSSCVLQVKDNKVHDNNSTSDEDALDLELRLGGHHHHHP